MATKRMATVEIMPGLYQRANFLSWTYDQKKKMLQELGITVVGNLWNNVDPDLSGQVISINSPIRGNAIPQSRTFILTVAALIKQGETVLVHCEAGVNRSAWFCAEVVAQLQGMTLAEAIAYVNEKQPRTNINMGLKPELEKVALAGLGETEESEGVDNHSDTDTDSDYPTAELGGEG